MLSIDEQAGGTLTLLGARGAVARADPEVPQTTLLAQIL